MSIALVDDQRVVWARGFGFRDRDRKHPATAETVYRVGSLSKLFTDVAVMRLVEQGKLDLDAPLTKYLPDFKPTNPFGDTPITLRMLMAHRSGLVREPPVGNYLDPTEPSLADTVASLNRTELVYPPGKKIQCSDAAIGVVGAVLEKTQGEKFEAYLTRHVLDPLGLKSSSFDPTPRRVRLGPQHPLRSGTGRQAPRPQRVGLPLPARRADRGRVDGENGETCRIKPQRPVEELRKAALAAYPPKEAKEFRAPELVDLASVDPTIRYDIRYASNNNFLGTAVYTSAGAFLQKPTAAALARVSRDLAPVGYGLLVYDAYRPWYVTKVFWDTTPAKFHHFVADPAKGSRQNRGCAVDLGLYDLRTGKPVEMVSGYDEFSDRAYPDYPGGTARQRWHRDLLRRAMKRHGFAVYEVE